MPLIVYYVYPQTADDSVVLTQDHTFEESELAVMIGPKEADYPYFFVESVNGVYSSELCKDEEKYPYLRMTDEGWEANLPFRNANEATDWMRFYERKHSDWSESRNS